MSTFNCLGFHLENEKGFRILIERALRFGRVLWPALADGADGGADEDGEEGVTTDSTDVDDDDDTSGDAPTHCVLWTVPGGAGIEVWILRDADENVVGCNPHLRSQLACAAHVSEDTDGVALVSCENFRVHAEIPNVPFADASETTVNLSMFVREIAVCEAQPNVTFTAEPGGDPLLVRFTAPIENARLAENKDTETLFGTGDLLLGGDAKLAIAIDPKRAKTLRMSELGGWVTGTGYLSAALPLAT